MKHRLQRDIYGNEILGTREHCSINPLHRSTISASSSLSAIPPNPSYTSASPSHILHSNQTNRRQTIDIHSPVLTQPDEDQLTLYLDDTIESTRL